MPLSADDFSRLALTAADALASKGTPLVETIDQIAHDNGMTLEQIKRLCEASNNAAFKALFDKADPSDREVTFDVARAEDVIARRRSKNVNTSEKNASFDAMSELRPLERKGYVPSMFGFAKEAAAPEPYVDPLEQKALEKKASQDAFNRSLEVVRLRDHLESEAATVRYKIGSAVTELVTHFRRLGPDWAPSALEAFEKNAMAEHGDACAQVLDSVRSALPYGPRKTTAKEASCHVVTHQPSFLSTRVEQAVKDLDRSRKIASLLETPGALEASVEQNHAG